MLSSVSVNLFSHTPKLCLFGSFAIRNLQVGENLSVNGCPSLASLHRALFLSISVSWDWLQPSCDPLQD